MRVDLVLKYICLVKSRSAVKHLCDDGALTVNERPVKPSHTVRPGDRVTLQFLRRTLTIQLTAVPEKQLSKELSLTYYEKVAELFSGDDDTVGG